MHAGSTRALLVRAGPVAVLVIGLGAMAWALLSYAGNALPYPDPTPGLLAEQAAAARRCWVVFGTGLCLAAAGGLWLWRCRKPTT